MKDYFLKLFQYNAWANSQALDCLARQTVTDEKTLTLMSHVLVAHYLWLHRIEALPKPPFALWQQYPLSQLHDMSAEIGRRWIAFIEAGPAFDRVLKYHNYTGDYFENRVDHIMIHVVNHATYHRGQVALRLRELGFEPVNTDFITYDRVVTGQLKA
jgi:uncharacterized damage-inducible protein DinB